jgi:hypothetical protein
MDFWDLAVAARPAQMDSDSGDFPYDAISGTSRVNIYGNGIAGLPFGYPRAAGPWRVQSTLSLTVISFFNTLNVGVEKGLSI